MGSETSPLPASYAAASPKGSRLSLAAGWTTDLALLTLLVALTTVFGRPFSKLGDAHLHLYVTEPTLLAIAVLGVRRVGLRGTLERIRTVVPAWAVLLLWGAGAIAATRGLLGFGTSRTADDIGLVEYSVLLALVPLVVDSRRRLLLLLRALLYASLASAAFYAGMRLAYPSETPLGSPDYAVGIYLCFFVLAVAARLVLRLAVGRRELGAALVAVSLMAWLPARTVWVAMLAAAAAFAVLAPRGRRLRVAAAGITVFVVAQAVAYPLQRIEDRRVAASASPTTPTVSSGRNVGPEGATLGPGTALAHPNYVADDGLSAWTGGRLVSGGAAQGRLSRLVSRGAVLDLGALTGLRPGATYTIVFSVEPLAPVATSGRVGNTADVIGWRSVRFRTAPAVRWQTFRRRLVATSTTERLAFSDDSGAQALRFDNVKVLRAGAPAVARSQPERPKQGAATRPTAPTIVSAVGGTLNPNVAAAKTENLNMRWRLAIWGFQLRTWAHEPLFGVGFGRPTDFRWSVTGGVYDARTGSSGPQDVTGPHNSFVNLLFRTGLAGAVPLVALLAIAAVRLRRWFSMPHSREDGALVLGLVAVLVFVIVTASFSVALEGPYMGMFFWGALALLFVAPPVLGREPGTQTDPHWPVVPLHPSRISQTVATLPWPLALMALWDGVLLIGGSPAAKLGLPGPIYPTEVLFTIAFAGLLLPRARFRERVAAVRAHPSPRWFEAAVLLFALAFALALARGLYTYGAGLAVKDAGLGYALLIPLVAFSVVSRNDWQDGFMRVLFWASVVTVPFLLLEFFAGTHVNPLSASIGFVLMFSLAPLVEDWLHGELPRSGRLYVVLLPAFVLWQVRSRSALASLVIGLLILVALNLRGTRRQVLALGASIAVVVAGVALYMVEPAALDKAPPVKLVTDTLNLTDNTKGNNARWRLDFAGALLHRSVESAQNIVVGVGLGKPSDFFWHENATTVEAYDYRGGPLPKHVVPNGSVSGPHNGFVDVVYRLGWPAALALVAIVAFAILSGARALRHASQRDARWIRVLLAATAAGIIVALTSDALRVPEAAVPFAVAVGLLTAYGLAARRPRGQ